MEQLVAETLADPKVKRLLWLVDFANHWLAATFTAIEAEDWAAYEIADMNHDLAHAFMLAEVAGARG